MQSRTKVHLPDTTLYNTANDKENLACRKLETHDVNYS